MLLDSSHRIVSFGEDQVGELYIVHHDASRGAVYKIVPATKRRAQ
jgi:hypothetical protein